MKSFLFLCNIFCLAAVSLAQNCKPVSETQISYLASKGIDVPDDYCHISGLGIYKLHEDLQNWNDARKICNHEGGRLAVINSEDEADALTKMFKNSKLMDKGERPSNGVFLGFHDLYHEGEFVTILGQPLEETGYSKWSEAWGGQPDNIDSGNPQNCGALAHDGALDDVQCSEEIGFICEIPTVKARF